MQCKFFMDPSNITNIPDSILDSSVVDQLNESDAELLNLLTTEEDCTAILNNIATNEQFQNLINSEANLLPTSDVEIEQFINKNYREIQEAEPVVEPPAVAEGFKCDQCGRVCSTKKLLKKHLLVHTAERKHPCEICGKLFRHKYEVNAHLKSHNKPTFQCEICSKMFIHKSHLTTHRRKHLGEFVAFCSECQIGFVTQSSFKIHRNVHHENLQLICDICGARPSSASALKEHKLIHEPDYGKERSHVCEFCGKSYLTSRNLKSHMKIHAKIKPYICSICGKSVSSKKILETHLKMHTGVKDFLCNMCNKSFASKEYLTVHQRIHVGDKPYECKVCGKRFTQKTSLTVHMRYHTGQRPYKCECGKEFTTKSHLMTHYKTHDIGGVEIEYISHPLRSDKALEYNDDKACVANLKCPLCDDVLEQKENIHSHLLGHELRLPCICPICNRIFTLKETFANHCLKEHFSTSKNHEKHEQIQCGVCFKYLKNKFSLKIHESRHKYMKTCEICSKVLKTNKEYHIHLATNHGQGPYACKICRRACYTKYSLKSHMALHEQTSKTIELFSCQKCNKKFDKICLLKNHIRQVHFKSDTKRFVCEYCCKLFVTNSTLQKHLMIHRNEMPYKCDVCLKNFRKKSTLTIHLRVHTGEKPYNCELCGSSFTQRHALKTHILSHTKENIFKCEFCESSFRSKKTRKSHVASKHGVTI